MGQAWQDALAELLRELAGLVKDGRELVREQIANERAEAEARAARMAGR